LNYSLSIAYPKHDRLIEISSHNPVNKWFEFQKKTRIQNLSNSAVWHKRVTLLTKGPNPRGMVTPYIYALDPEWIDACVKMKCRSGGETASFLPSARRGRFIYVSSLKSFLSHFSIRKARPDSGGSGSPVFLNSRARDTSFLKSPEAKLPGAYLSSENPVLVYS
jgi:hypothetical protein